MTCLESIVTDLSGLTVNCGPAGWDCMHTFKMYSHGLFKDRCITVPIAELQRRTCDHHWRQWCHHFFPSFPCLAWYGVWMQEGEGFTGGSLKAIREQHTDRMRAVNRGKQGRAEDTVTLYLPPPLPPHTHSHSVIFSTQHFLWPHTYSNKPLHLALPAHVSHPPDSSPWRTDRAITHSSRHCFHYLFVWHLISGSLLLFVHLSALSHLGLSVSFDGCHPFGTMCTAMDRKHLYKSTASWELFKRKKVRSGLWPCGIKQKLHINGTWDLGRGREGASSMIGPQVMKKILWNEWAFFPQQ